MTNERTYKGRVLSTAHGLRFVPDTDSEKLLRLTSIHDQAPMPPEGGEIDLEQYAGGNLTVNGQGIMIRGSGAPA